MEQYDKAAEATALAVISGYSTSFGTASKLFAKAIRQDIYNIYGLVRVADEIVDTYLGKDAAKLLDELEAETAAAVERGFSANTIVHAYALTARRFTIDGSLATAFFASMRMDLHPEKYHAKKDYAPYIYGSAEVVGLMCLAVFCGANQQLYAHLEPGARALGSAFQKVNFLRDLAADNKELGRYYFPIGNYESFDEATKLEIIADIAKEFALAKPAIDQLPTTARPAVRVAYRYYNELLNMLSVTPATDIKHRRVRVSDARKLRIIGSQLVRRR